MHDPLDDLDDNDPALLQAAVGPVRRIQAVEPPRRPKPAGGPQQLLADERDALRSSHVQPFAAGEPGEVSRYRRPEIPERTLKRLRRGLFAVQDEFDLHHLQAEAATQALRLFLAEAQSGGLRCVRVIHGKGRHSQGGESVLRPLVESHLRHRQDVLAYASAPPSQGGTGALLVLLQGRR
jgi:DNA-nicking Smr family endonuclease